MFASLENDNYVHAIYVQIPKRKHSQCYNWYKRAISIIMLARNIYWYYTHKWGWNKLEDSLKYGAERDSFMYTFMFW